MTKGSGQRWLITSATVVGGTYAYMKWQGRTDTPVQEFVTAWGAVYFVLALVTEASPQFGGAFAALVMVSDLLDNAPRLIDALHQAQIPTTPTPRRTTRR